MSKGDRIKCACGAKSTITKWIKDHWEPLCMKCRLKMGDTDPEVDDA